MSTRREGSHLQAGKRALTKKQIGWHLDPGPPASRTVRNEFLLLSHPVYGIFVMAALAELDSVHPGTSVIMSAILATLCSYIYIHLLLPLGIENTTSILF